jgi:para-nitrobenzyl esterase
MTSPLAKGLIAGAIGESGAMITPTLPAVPLADAEQRGSTFGETNKAASLAALRAMSAEDMQRLGGLPPGRFPAAIDGYVLPAAPVDIFKAGQQAKVPLLIGSNSEEGGWPAVLGTELFTGSDRRHHDVGKDRRNRCTPGALPHDANRVNEG